MNQILFNMIKFWQNLIKEEIIFLVNKNNTYKLFNKRTYKIVK